MKFTFSAIFAALVTVCASAKDHYAEMDSYLQRTFNNQRLSWTREATTPIAAPGLQPFLPHTKFYRVTLRSWDIPCFPMELLVAATTTPTQTSFVYCFSPINYNGALSQFSVLFHGIRTTSAGQRTELARAIADLLAALNFEGRSGVISSDASHITVQLFWGKVYDNLIVTFDTSGALDQLEIRNPKK